MQDRNFDDIADKFAENIYGSDKGDLRQKIVEEDIEQLLTVLNASSTSLTVLDAGGGLGQIAQILAKKGHSVTLCDVSQAMLTLAKKSVVEQKLDAQFRFVHASIQEFVAETDQTFDVILFHAVMEWLVDPQSVLTMLLKKVKPNGMISIMFYNHHGLVLKNVVCGNIPHVLQGMPHRKRFKLQPPKGLLPENVYQWIEAEKFNIQGKSGIRCFHDYIGNQKYMGAYTTEEIGLLEQKLCRTEPYLSLGRYIHVWAQKPSKDIQDALLAQ